MFYWSPDRYLKLSSQVGFRFGYSKGCGITLE
jgi:hypothetical protein